MLTWFPGDEAPKEEWNAIVHAYFTLQVSPESVDTALLFEALKSVLKKANETGYCWDASLQIAEAIAGKKSSKTDGVS